MLEINSREIYKLEKKLGRIASRSLPFAIRKTLNDAAFQTRLEAQKTIGEKMTLRNRWTQRQVAVERAAGLDIRRMYSVVGGTVDYLATQEFGGTTSGPIATSYSAGQGRAPKRTRLPRKPNKMRNIQLKAKSRRGGRKAQNAAAVRSGERFVFLDLGRRKGIFRIIGKRRPRIEMVWSIERGTRRIPRNPWLAPSMKTIQQRVPEYYAKALRFQLKRVR